MTSGVNLSVFLQSSGGRFFDPLHGHSFHRIALNDLNAVQHSRLFFRDCLVCHQRLLVVGKPNLRRRRIPDEVLKTSDASLFSGSVAPVKGEIVTSRSSSSSSLLPKRVSSEATTPADSEALCQCLDCGNYVHRECLSQCHAHRFCRRHDELMPRCPHTKAASPAGTSEPPATASTPVLFGSMPPVIKRVMPARRRTSSNVTISSLIDELSEDRADASAASGSSAAKKNKTTAATMMKKAAPFLAAGGVLGAIALGPAAGVLAGLNVLVAGVTVEGMVAGLGFTAATAAATATHQIKKKQEKKRQQDETKSGSWAMQVCWKVKQAFRDVPPSDESFRKDAEFLRRFQLPRRTSSEIDHLQPADHFAPSTDEVYMFLFGVFSASTEFLSQVNAELGMAFADRYAARLKRVSASSLDAKKAIICKETLQDAKMYVAHLVGATMQSFPSLASTEAAIVSCSQAVERIVYDDVYKTVMGVLDDAFTDENMLFNASLEEIRRQPGGPQQILMLMATTHHTPASTVAQDQSKSPLQRDPDLSEAEHKLVAMSHTARSPLHMLELLCAAFRSICYFADKVHKTAANADILIPIVCAVLVSSPQLAVSSSTKNFVSQIAFISFFTDGGGKGVEGYVLTTFQAALQVIAAVDLSQGHAKELELFPHQDATEEETLGSGGSSADDEDDGEEFFDATS